ncbi:hypothetical protein F5Y19DRAFT_472156 [Xylariaceae sp. FL1651]|nr:hypothetical protein F5Y19DRAFT_472156 [Xylariaceae sp. FL1651]
MDRIPPELLYVICSLLSVDDILNFRLVNRAFADVGAAYMLPEVTFDMHHGELDRLRAISLHPLFAKHVSSLTYFAQTLDSPKLTWREFLRDHKQELRWNSKLKKLNLTPNNLLAEYQKYTEAVAKQEDIMDQKLDIALLKEVLPRFPNLRTMTMSAGNVFYEGRYRTRRHRPLEDFIRNNRMCSIHPEGNRPLEALLMANARAGCALTSLRAGSLHWRFFKRTERDLARMFRPLANLTSIEFSISVDPADERIHENSSLRKCRRVLAKGAIRSILKSMPHLQSLRIEVLTLDYDELEKGARLVDLIEPGFRWPNLRELVLGGIESDRPELMRVLGLHKDTLQKLCLRDITLTSTSWRKLLPDIRKTLSLADACICGDIYGHCEDDDEDMIESPWGSALAEDLEYWDLSVPEVGTHDMRDSINMYCREGGRRYPPELPLSHAVVCKYYDEYVEPFFEDDWDTDSSNEEDGEPELDIEVDLSGEGNEDNWEDVSSEEYSDDMSDATTDSLAYDDALDLAMMDNGDLAFDGDLVFHIMMSALGGPLGMVHTDDDEEVGLGTDADDPVVDTGGIAVGMEESGSDSDDQMPELIP